MEIGKNLSAALLKAQKELDSVEKQGTNPHFKSTFAELADVLDAVKPALNSAGIVFLQLPSTPKFEGTLALTTVLIHAASGESLEATAEVPLVKADPQAYGSAVTYTRRYSLLSILGLKTVDDDGNDASGRDNTAPVKEKPANPAGFSFKKKAEDTTTAPAPTTAAKGGKKTSLFPEVK